ncbi:sensor histidine kinase [Catenuloplanes japonicus]|uniref:sensor histidine kinase n=1 Tax=Catenuloplanes japonicus TaxID=33876 RepID=UPI000527CF18|nr:histidine kinase [Catenuloplanes japonicus]
MRDDTPALRRQSLLIALGCVIGDGAPFLLHAASAPQHPAVWIAGLAIVAADLALALPARTAGPVAVLHAVVRIGVMALLFTFTGERDNGIGNATGLVVSAYRAGAWLRGPRSYATLAVLITGLFVTQALQGFSATAPNILLTFSNTVLPWLLGRHTTGLAGHIGDVRRRAEEQRRSAAEAMEAERTAIARDLHDTISHHVSAVGMHASAARLAIGAGSARVTGSLQQVETSSRAALSDLRRMLDLLHGTDTDGVQQPGLGALDDLIARAGLAVRPHLTGLDPQRLPDSLNLAAYRIIQEIMTNALRHGDGTLDLEIIQTVAGLRVSGANPVSSHPRPRLGTGRGLDGIRHRTAMFGGTVDTGPDGTGRWRTTVIFPLQETR